MKDASTSQDWKSSINQLLVFQIQNTSFGVDTRQVASIRDPISIDPDEIQIVKLHEIVAFKNQSIEYTSPKILLVNLEEEAKGLYIEAPDDIVFLKPSEIRPIPQVIVKLNTSKAIWGAFIKGGRTILILDIHTLLTQ